MNSYTIDKFIEGFFSYPSTQSTNDLVFENDDSYKVEVELPGFKKENIEVNVDGDYLTVDAIKEPPSDEEKPLYRNRSKTFKKSYKMGATIDRDDISADFTDGVLTIILKKKEAAKKRTVKIT